MKKYGFLSPNLPALIANIRKNGACQFAVAEAFNELGMCALRDIHIDPANRQEVLGDSLFGRVLTSFQSAVILCERGLLSDAATLIRSAAETAIILTAVARDANVCDTLILGIMHQERTLAQSWLHESPVNMVLSKEDVDALRNRIAAIERDYPAVNNPENIPIRLDILADTYGSSALYNIVRRISALNAVHATLGALRRQAKDDSAVAVQGFKFGPDEEDLPATLSDALSVMSSALISIYHRFPEVKHQDDFEKCLAAWRSLSI
jgi:hypothetical protein